MQIEQVCESRSGEQTIVALRALFAERCRADAGWLAALHDAGRSVAGRRARLAALDDFSGDEVCAALGWSRSMAGRMLSLADDLLERLPEVHAAMAEGTLELAKARVFSDWTRELDPDHAHHVCEVLLPEAPRSSLGELISRVQAVAAALDPVWAQRRLEAAHRGAAALGRTNPAGTADLTGRDLDPTAALAAMARIDALALELSTALRARDVTRPIAWLRAQVYQRLLDGHAAGHDDDTLLEALLVELTPPDPDDGDDDGGDGGGDDPGGPDPDDPGGPDDGGPDDGGPDDSPDHGGEPTPGDGPADSPADAVADGAELGEAPEARGIVRTGCVEVRLQLSTAMGLDDTPAEVPTWGTVTAATARTLLHDRHHGEWRLVLTDPDGHLEHLFLLTRRPHREIPPRADPPAHHRPRDRAVIELRIAIEDLLRLRADQHPSWAAVLRQAHDRLAALDALAPEARRDSHPATTRADAARRRAGAELDRWIRVRDRHCIGVMCTRPAHRAELDHTHDWAHHGPSVAGNLGAVCKHTHRLKHLGGWQLHQPRPGHFRWASRAGAVYDLPPRPVAPPLPAPRRRPDGRVRIPVEEHLVPVLDEPDVHADPGGRGAPAAPRPRRSAAPHYPEEPPF